MAKSKKNAAAEPVIDDSNFRDHFSPVVDGQPKGHGLVPRDYATFPAEMFAPPSEVALIPRSEWSERIKDKVKQQSQISDVLKAAGIPSLDQSQSNYCWAHSVTGCVQATRAINNQPYVPLSAYAVAAIIKKGANEGGWCGLSAKFVREVGVPSQQLWPQGKFSLSLDTPQLRTNAALHKVTEDWVDLTRQVYDQNLSFEIIASLLLSDVPCAVDFNWWSHSVMACDLAEPEPGSFGLRIRNSWGDSYGELGFAVLKGQKTIPDGAVALRVTGISPT